jgi:hypothetical protein
MVIVAACGSDGDVPPPTSAGATGPVSSAGSGGAGGDSSSASGSSSGGGGSVPVDRGSIDVHNYQQDALLEYWGVRATFLPAAEAGAEGCTDVAEGPCVITTCPRAGAGGAGGSGGGPVAANAGTLDIAGGLTPLALEPDKDGTYADASGNGAPFFEDAARLEVSAAGDAIPGFSISVEAPLHAALTDPPFDVVDDTVIDRSAALELAWDDGSHELVVELMPRFEQTVVVTCVFDAADGEGTIPAAALSHLPAGEGSFYASTRSQVTDRAGTWEVTFQLIDYAKRPEDNVLPNYAAGLFVVFE